MHRLKVIGGIRKLPSCKPIHPKILLTLDSNEPMFERQIRPILEIFAHHGIPLTIFVSNETLSGRNNSGEIGKILEFSKRRHLTVEIASHGVCHRDMSHARPDKIAGWIAGSERSFREQGIVVKGFRAPYLSIEACYEQVLKAMEEMAVPLAYDSSISFESNLVTSILNLACGIKGPHKIGRTWELPISALDDYHLFKKRKTKPSAAFLYWAASARIWIWRKNYFMLLFHPHTIISHLHLLNQTILFMKKKFNPVSFTTCQQLALDLDSQKVRAIFPN